MINYESQDFSRVPIFIGRLLSKMEENGIKIKSLPAPEGTFTYRHKSNLSEFLESPDFGFKEEEITHSVHEDIINSFLGKELSIFTITPYVDSVEKTFSFYIRMIQ
jgi:hypothetical protein